MNASPSLDELRNLLARGRSLSKQSACWQRPLSFPRPQGCIRADGELFAQARRLIEAKQALAGLIDPRDRLRRGPPFASRYNHLQASGGALDVRHVAAPGVSARQRAESHIAWHLPMRSSAIPRNSREHGLIATRTGRDGAQNVTVGSGLCR